MKIIVVLVVLGFFFGGQSLANQVSLIEDEDVPKDVSVVKEETVDNKEISLAEDENDNQQDDLEEVNDFINQENEKLKDIKLLNLDLEKVGIELKRREIEQKIAQLDKTEGILAPTQDSSGDIKLSKPQVRLVGVFESASKKQAVLSINGEHINVKEGQEVEDIVVKTIKPQGVTIQYQDGQLQELYFL